jgi:hypothetical protein
LLATVRRSTVITERMDLLGWLRKQLAEADTDLLREMVRSFAEALMGAEADAVCGAPYGEVSLERVNRRNGYRQRRWDNVRYCRLTRWARESRPSPPGSDPSERSKMSQSWQLLTWGWGCATVELALR